MDLNIKIKKDKALFSLDWHSNGNKEFLILKVILFLALVLAILSAKDTEQFKCLNNVINHLAMIYKALI